MLKIIPTTLALLFTPVAALAQDELIIPTEMCRDYFFVPIVVSAQPGRPESDADRTLWLIYDTGAARTHVDPDAIARVANMDVSHLDGVNITNATMGPLNIDRLPVRLDPLDHLTVGLGREIDGILGYTVFRDFLMTLDYENGVIRLNEGELSRPDNATIFSTRGPGVRPFIELDFPGRRDPRVLIDSGAAGTPLALNRIDRYPLVSEPRPIGASIRFSRIEYRDGSRVDGDVRLGDFVFEQPLLEEVPETQVIGGMMMRHFNWTFDIENERVRLDRIEGGGAIAMEAEITHGLALRPQGRNVVIDAIVPGSRATEAGLAVGDVLTHFDGLPVAERGCGFARGETMPESVTVRRQSDEADIILPLVTLVD